MAKDLFGPVLEMRGIHKRFPGVHALKGVDFQLYPGEVHALVGENGAGKSTLIKIISGVHDFDEGSTSLTAPLRMYKTPWMPSIKGSA